VPELDSDIISAPEDEPLVLSGPPQELSGRVELHNPGKVNIVIRDASLNDPSGVLISRPLRRALRPLVLHPDQGHILPLKLAVDKKTPPGMYQVNLDLAGRSRSAVLNVTEAFDLTVQPKSIVVMNLANQVQRKQLIVTNEGNVAFTIGDIGEVDLKDDMVWDRSVRLAVEQLTDRVNIDRANIDIEELVVAVLRVTREDAYRRGILLVHNASGKVELKPGQTATIDLEITLPEELPYNSRYRGLTPILTQDLEFIVVSSSGPEEQAPPKPPVRRATKTAEKTTTVSRKTPTRQRGKK
jgi:hypothetical protein